MNALARKGVLLVFAVILAVGTSIGSLLPTIAYAQEPEYCTIKVTVAPSFTGTVAMNDDNFKGQVSNAKCIVGGGYTVKAQPNEGYTFVNWTIDGQEVSTNPTYTFTAQGDTTVQANFAEEQVEPEYALAKISIPIDQAGWGQVALNDDDFGGAAFEPNGIVGQTYTAKAKANEGYAFVNWTIDGEEVGTDPEYTFILEKGGTTVQANFKKTSLDPDFYHVDVAYVSPEFGKITVNGEDSKGFNGDYQEGTTFELNAIAADGYQFVNWTDGDKIVSTEPNFTYIVAGSANLKANFEKAVPEPEYCTIKAIVPNDQIGWGLLSGNDGEFKGQFNDAKIVVGSKVTLKAQPNEGYTFVNWTINGQEVSTNSTYTFTAQGDTIVQANFAKEQTGEESYFVSIEMNPATSAGIIVINGEESAGITNHSFVKGTEIVLAAEPLDGWKFVNWTNNGVIVSEDASFTYSVQGDTHLVAHFVKFSDPVVDPDDPNNPPADPKDPALTDPDDNIKAEDNKSKDSEDKTKSDASKELPKTADNSLYSLGVLGFVGAVSLIAALVAARRRA